MFVVKFKLPRTRDTTFALYATEDDALLAAAAEIMDIIIAEWDINVIGAERATAEEIDKRINNSEFFAAIDLYNDEERLINPAMPGRISVVQRQVQQRINTITPLPPLPGQSPSPVPTGVPTGVPAGVTMKISGRVLTSNLKPYFVTIPPKLPKSIFAPTPKPGATCRGACAQYNEFAYADRPDGTHVCYSCRTLPQLMNGVP